MAVGLWAGGAGWRHQIPRPFRAFLQGDGGWGKARTPPRALPCRPLPPSSQSPPPVDFAGKSFFSHYRTLADCSRWDDKVSQSPSAGPVLRQLCPEILTADLPIVASPSDFFLRDVLSMCTDGRPDEGELSDPRLRLASLEQMMPRIRARTTVTGDVGTRKAVGLCLRVDVV